MAITGENKRKRKGDDAAQPKKKVVIDGPASTATVSSVVRPKFSPPVIITAPGLQMPKDTVFHSYAAREERSISSKRPKPAADTELLLHTGAHQSLDYTAREERRTGSKPTLNHFLGVYDPKTGRLQLIEAKKMVVRGSVRAKQASAEAMGQRHIEQSIVDRRADLGQTFGTKRAKKALEDAALNLISPQKKPGDDSPVKIDAATRAMLTSVGQVTSTMASREDLQAAVDAAKPAPTANLEAEDIEDVYDPVAIIGPDILNMLPIREWQEKARHGESIEVLSRYVAARVNQLATDEAWVMQLRVLRYLYILLLFFLTTTTGKQKGTRQILPREKLKEKLQPAPDAVIEHIRRKFSDNGVIRKFHMDMVYTHCCAFACIVDNFEVDTQNLKDDLKMDQKTMNQYFHEIGARVKPVTNKAMGRTTYVARLTLPLDFPKQRHFVPRR